MQPEIPAVERPLFFEGQRLMPADLVALQAFDRELRWLHNRSLHGWGVVQGFTASGARGDRTVTVTGGYALDCLGRELVLAGSRVLDVPAVAEPTIYYLTVSYREDGDQPAETRSGVCGTSGAVRLGDEPTVRFQDAGATGDGARRPGLDVVLATASVRGCRLAEPLALGEREELRGDQAYVGAGRTQPGGTAWRLWPDANAPLGLATTVETSVAGFRSTPRYQANVVGDRLDEGKLVIDGYAHVENATAGSFDLCVVLPDGYTVGADGALPLNPGAVLDPGYLDHVRFELGWHVVWMGVEG